MLGEVKTDRYCNRRVTHSDRNFVTQTVIELLEQIIPDSEKTSNLIIPKNTPNINPPDES
jgi:hypothetical protein